MILPRNTPERDAKYMGEAWMKAGFSKDPNTQVGCVIIGHQNRPISSGYNGPPSAIPDTSFSWERPPESDPTAFSKYDVIFHAERNAIKWACGADLSEATMYVTALPCPDCMLEIAHEQIRRVVYFDFKASAGSILNSVNRKKSMKIAELARINLEEFHGNLGWIPDWCEKLKQLHIFDPKG